MSSAPSPQRGEVWLADLDPTFGSGGMEVIEGPAKLDEGFDKISPDEDLDLDLIRGSRDTVVIGEKTVRGFLDRLADALVDLPPHLQERTHVTLQKADAVTLVHVR